MYHAVCREYIPNGENLDDDAVDEVGRSQSWMLLGNTTRLTSSAVCCWLVTATPRGLPIDIARAVCFLASQDGEWVNGKVLGIDGAACM